MVAARGGSQLGEPATVVTAISHMWDDASASAVRPVNTFLSPSTHLCPQLLSSQPGAGHAGIPLSPSSSAELRHSAEVATSQGTSDHTPGLSTFKVSENTPGSLQEASVSSS